MHVAAEIVSYGGSLVRRATVHGRARQVQGHDALTLAVPRGRKDAEAEPRR